MGALAELGGAASAPLLPRTGDEMRGLLGLADDEVIVAQVRQVVGLRDPLRVWT